MKEIFKSVEISYFDEDSNFWCVDAWRTDDDNEEGKVVAVIHESGDYYITDPDAQICSNVHQAISDKVSEIKGGERVDATIRWNDSGV